MNEIINFITTHYQLIIEGVLLVVSVLFFILRKREVSSIDADIFNLCIKAVNFYENSELKGVKKLDAATLMVINELQKMYPKADCGVYFNFVVSCIEKILTTPQKKGGK